MGDSLIGEVFEDRYEIVECIGRGGTATVYRARQLRMGRDVAIKVLTQGLGSRERETRRFEREAGVTSLLRHPNTIAAYDFGISSSGLYLVMELLQGVTLGQRLKEVAILSADRVAQIGIAIASSLAETHAKGIVHRDLKPANVFLHQVHGMEVVKVLDFGNAWFIAEDAAISQMNPLKYQTTQIAEERVVVGSAHYIAPEQIIHDNIDGRADIYALGAIMHEMLLGEPPYTDDDTNAVLHMHVEGPMPTLPETLPEPLRILITVMLAKNPSHRPATADEVVDGLRRYIGDSGMNRMPTVSQRKSRSSRPPIAAPPALETAESPGDNSLNVDFGHTGDPAPAGSSKPALGRQPSRQDVEVQGEHNRPATPATPSSVRRTSNVSRPAMISARKSVERRLPRWPLAAVLVVLIGVGAWFTARKTNGMQSLKESPVSTAAAALIAPTTAGIGLASAPDGWRRIQSGSFRMGSGASVMGRHPNEGPQHMVTLSHDFYLKATEVTRAEWGKLFEDKPGALPENFAMDSVNWFEAAAFCNELSRIEGLSPCYTLAQCTGKPGAGMTCGHVGTAGLLCAGYRLPWEAEWEYAARAVDASAMLQDRKPAGPGARQPAGSDVASVWGLHEMLGGVSEWVNDWYDAGYYRKSPATDPMGPALGTRRGRRGCTWRDPDFNCRPATRFSAPANRIDSGVGFRVARTIL